MTSRFALRTLVAAILLAGCNSGTSSSPSSSSEGRSSPVSSSGQGQSELAVSLGVDDLLLRPTASIQVLGTNDFKSLYAGEQKYLDMFGVRHARMVFQQVQIGSAKGTATYVEFSTESEAEQAASKSGQSAAQRPSKTLRYGKVVILVQSPGSLDEFARAVETDLENRASGSR